MAGRAAGHGGGTPRPSPPAQRRGPFCPSPPCLCAAGTGIFHLPAPLVVTSTQSSQAPALVSGFGLQGQRELLPPPLRRTLILTRGWKGDDGNGGGKGWDWRWEALETCPSRATLPVLSCLCTSNHFGTSLPFPASARSLPARDNTGPQRGFGRGNPQLTDTTGNRQPRCGC